MKLLFFCTYWGSERMKWSDFLAKVKKSGYDGVEFCLPEDIKRQKQMLAELNDHGLQWIGVHWDTVTSDFIQHKIQLEKRLSALAVSKPLFITSHTGKDHFSFKQNFDLLSTAQEISRATQTSIYHETHRGKFSFASHITKNYLEKIPDLLLTLDISHWFAVAESYLEDQNESVLLALSKTRHIHSRIGCTQGPQVDDPRKEIWIDTLAQHFKHWDKAVAMRLSAGADYFTFTSEFGPYPYMSSAPVGKSTENHQWELNEYMKKLLKNRYENR